jgi:hypothetical protein
LHEGHNDPEKIIWQLRAMADVDNQSWAMKLEA